MRINAKQKKYITVIAMVFLAASVITTPNVRGVLPDFILNSVNLIAYAVLIGAFWVGTSQTE